MAAPVPHLESDPTAVFGRRVVAFVIDSVVVGVPGVAIASSQYEYYDADEAGLSGAEFCDRYLAQFDSAACVSVGDTAYYAESGFSAASLAPLALSLLMFVVIQGLTGWTLGKLLLGLRTVKENGTTVGIGKALGRWLLLIVDSLPCLGLVGLITAGTSTGHRRVGDMAARTYVVRSDAAGSPIRIPGSATMWSPGAPDASQAMPVGAWGSPSGGTDGPQWDEARGTYIQWDPAQGKWMQWDEAARSWSPIAGQ